MTLTTSGDVHYLGNYPVTKNVVYGSLWLKLALNVGVMSGLHLVDS